MGVALDKAAIVAIFMESVLWGGLVLMFPLVVFFLLRNAKTFQKRMPHLLVTTIIFTLCTAHAVLSYMRATSAFTGESKRNPVLYLQQIADTLSRGKYGVLFFTIFFGDLVIVSRCFSLWNKNYLVALLPALMSIGTAVCGCVALSILNALKNTDVTTDSKFRTWLVATYSLTLATKLLCMVLIASRANQIHASFTSFNLNRHVRILTTMTVLNESGLLAVLFTVLTFPAAVTNVTEHVVFCDVLSPATGITIMSIFAGMTIDFSNTASSPHAISHPAFPPAILTTRPSGVGIGVGIGIGSGGGGGGGIRRAVSRRWDDPDFDPELELEFEEDLKAGSHTPKSPASSSSYDGFVLKEAKSSGTLNTGVVI